EDLRDLLPGKALVHPQDEERLFVGLERFTKLSETVPCGVRIASHRASPDAVGKERILARVEAAAATAKRGPPLGAPPSAPRTAPRRSRRSSTAWPPGATARTSIACGASTRSSWHTARTSTPLRLALCTGLEFIGGICSSPQSTCMSSISTRGPSARSSTVSSSTARLNIRGMLETIPPGYLRSEPGRKPGATTTTGISYFAAGGAGGANGILAPPPR